MRASDILTSGIMLLVAALLQGCGHKGPLVLPQTQSTTQQPSQGQ